MYQIGKLLLLLCLLSLVFVASGALLTYLSRDAVLEEMLDQAKSRDFVALETRFAWEDLRTNVKERIRRQKQAVNSLNMAQISSGPSENDINDVVDYYIQPDNLPILMALKDREFPVFEPEDFVQSVGFASPFSWKASFGMPSKRVEEVSDVINNPAIVSKVQSAMQVTLVFELQGLTWRVTQMRVPLFMVPRRAYNEPLENILRLDIQQ